MGVCEICNTNDHKYKCPKCQVQYCSVICFQKHKKETDSNGESICKEIIPPPPPPPLEPTERTFDEDALTENQLKAIESSPELKKMLKDSILQIYLQTLDTSLEPESVFDKLQGNQKFDEFYSLGDSSLFRGVRQPHNAVIVTAVGTGLFAGFAYMFHIMKNDPTIVWTNKVNNPYPWLNISQNKNLKLYAVNNKFEDSSVRETFIVNKRPDA